MASSNHINSDQQHTQNIEELERRLGDNPKICIKGGGKTKIMNLEQLRKPHCVKPSARVPVENTAGGLLRTGGHRPQLSNEEVSKRRYENLHEQEER
ncbi:YLR361C-A [Saccharomyces arboricola H-6]|uniref:YLR361C-A n=1 Tax=Saccharomyces arboricola (strain H-6 / AS 2.3317 / CBS 10644) TaxID=1160507 RepID=J8PZ21_SACAR|nr:YLR361C-A [Saccharomyces arboricola H-6]